MVVDPPAAEIVRRIFHMVAEGNSAVQTAQILNRECVPTPLRCKQSEGHIHMGWNCIGEENFWTGSAIIRIVRDEQYLGKVVFGKRFYDIVGGRHSVKVSKKDWIITADAHEAIVTQTEFDSAQAALHEFAERERTSKDKPLYRKIRCTVCGYAMTRAGGKAPYYVCHTSRVTDAFPCPTQKISEQDIFAVLLDDLHLQAATAVDLERIWEERHQQEKKDAGAMRKSLAALKSSLEQQNRQILGMYESFATGGISKSDYLTTKAAAVQQRDSIAARMAELEAALENVGADGKLQNFFVSSFQKYAETQKITDEIVSHALKEVFVHPDGKLEIVWNHRDEFERMLVDLYRSE